MKSLLFAATLIGVTTNAVASDFFFKPYVGADYEYTSVNYKGNIDGSGIGGGDLFTDSFNGGDIHVGARVHKYLGFEASYSDTASESKSGILGTTASSSVKLEQYAVDAMGYLPVDDARKLELIATAGVARTNASGSVTVSGTTYSGKGWETKGRVGGGVEYWLTDNVNVRGLVRYQDASFGGLANDAVITSLGVNWQF